jgi:pimeloyl-ACP methyl ester carboxylesterase
MRGMGVRTRKLLTAFGVMLIVALLGACQTTSNVDCSKVDYVHYIPTDDGCLSITIKNASTADENPTMLVFLNGDQYGSGYKLNLSKVVSRSYERHALYVEVSRPGYVNWRGDQSSGSAQFAGSAPASEADHVAAGIRNLAQHYNVSRLVLVGQSGGAAYAGVITGRHAGLVDIAILHGCPCDYTQLSTNAYYAVAMNPQSYVSKIPVTTSVVAINGREDTYTPWRPVRYYINTLKDRGVPSRLVLTRGGHFMSEHWSDVKKVINLAMARDRTAFDEFVSAGNEDVISELN